MKKIIALFALSISLTAFGQEKKDTVKPAQYDTVFVFTVNDIYNLKNILLESKVIVSGSQLTGNELSQLLQWIDSKGTIFKKELPKK